MKEVKQLNIEEVYQHYIKSVYITGQIGPTQDEELRKSFYAGIIEILTYVMQIAEKETEDDAADELDRIMKQITLFFTNGGKPPLPAKPPDVSSALVRAPFTEKDVEALNKFQKAGMFHPFTCGNSCGVELVATTDGWKCPTCDYKQNWAHAFMTQPLPPAPFTKD